MFCEMKERFIVLCGHRLRFKTKKKFNISVIKPRLLICGSLHILYNLLYDKMKLSRTKHLLPRNEHWGKSRKI